MAIELVEKIDLKIKTQAKTSVFPLMVHLNLSLEDEAVFKQFEKEQEEKNKDMQEATEKGQSLAKQIGRLGEDIEDLNDELNDGTLDASEKRTLQKERKKLRRKLRKLEDALEAHNKAHDITQYKKAINDLLEDIAKKSFELNVQQDEKRDALVAAMERLNMKYSVVTSEIGRLIQEAKKKKKRRS